MSPTSQRCASPQRCGAQTHVPGTAAARACAARAPDAKAAARVPASTPPPVACDVEEVLGGTITRLARPHPTGGYDLVTTGTNDDYAYGGNDEEGAAPELKTTSYTLDGAPHRADGPAYVEVDDDGDEVKREWHVAGQMHRGDGPALERPEDRGEADEYHYRGLATAHGLSGRAELREVLAVEGVDPEVAVGWLGYPLEVVAELAPVVDDPLRLRAPWQAGARGAALVAAATSRAPTSWVTR